MEADPGTMQNKACTRSVDIFGDECGVRRDTVDPLGKTSVDRQGRSTQASVKLWEVETAIPG